MNLLHGLLRSLIFMNLPEGEFPIGAWATMAAAIDR
jgi:hypothetical protein